MPIVGRVVGAEGEPLSGAAVKVLGTMWQDAAGPRGGFRLALPRGEWRLAFRRIGYRPDTLALTVARPIDSLVVRLAPDPVALTGLTVEAEAAPPMVRTVTTETVRQVPPLGEPDVFRAVVLLPGVSQPNDLKGRIHLAGGSSDETGIRLDGHPLQDPFHLLGLFGAFNVAALEEAHVRIHHLPPHVGGRLSGVIDIETRRPGAEPYHEAVVSLLTSGVTVSEPSLPGGFDLLASGRVSYLDKVMPLFYPSFPRLGFYDALLRLGRSWESGWRVEALGFRTRDRFVEADLAGLELYEPLTWGESLVGLRVEHEDAGPWDALLRASFGRATVHLDERAAGGSDYVQSTRDWASLEVRASRTGRRWRVSGGAALNYRTNTQRWVARGLIDEIFTPHTPARFHGRDTLRVVSLFGAGALELGTHWTVRAGARLSAAGGEWYPAPRLQVSWRATPDLRLHAAVDRRYQFDAELEEPVAGSVTAPLFLLEDPRRADVAALAAEWTPEELPFGATGELRLEAFWKHYPDRPVLSERESTQTAEEFAAEFPRFRRVPGRSVGASLAGRVRWEDVLVQASYAWQRVRVEYRPGEWSPTPWDVPHTLTLFASVPLGGGWTFNTVWRAHSGAAATPIRARIFGPPLHFPDGGFLLERYIEGEPNSLRLPPYRRLDVGVRHHWDGWGARWTLFFQVLNVLNHQNPVGYNWQQYFAGVRSGIPGGPEPGHQGLPVLPSIGLEVRW